MWSRSAHVVLGGADGAGCSGLPHEVGGAVLVHEEPRAHGLNTEHRVTHQTDVKCSEQTSFTDRRLFTHHSSSGADQVDACRVAEFLAVGHADRAVGELQQQPVPALDDRPSLGDTHVTD